MPAESCAHVRSLVILRRYARQDDRKVIVVAKDIVACSPITIELHALHCELTTAERNVSPLMCLVAIHSKSANPLAVAIMHFVGADNSSDRRARSLRREGHDHSGARDQKLVRRE